MPDDLYGAVLIQAQRRRALIERPDISGLISAAIAARSPATPPQPAAQASPPAEAVTPLRPGAKYASSSPEDIARFFGRRPSSIPKG